MMIRMMMMVIMMMMMTLDAAVPRDRLWEGECFSLQPELPSIWHPITNICFDRDRHHQNDHIHDHLNIKMYNLSKKI